MACSNVSGAFWQLGQVVGVSLSVEGWARRYLFPDLIWCRRPAENLSRPINGWGFSEGPYGYLDGSGASSSYSSMRRFLHVSMNWG